MSEPTIDDFIAQLQSPQADVRRNAAWVLGRFRDMRIVQPLLRCLQDTDATVRARAAESLGARREAMVVLPLIDSLQDPHPDVRRMVVRSLGFIADEQAINPILECMQDADATVRSHAAEAFGNMALASHAEHLELTPTIPVLLAALIDDEDANVRYYAMQSLQIINTSMVHQALIEAVKQQDDPAIIIDLMTLIGKIVAPVFEPVLDEYTQHSDADVVMMAQWALSALAAQSDSSE